MGLVFREAHVGLKGHIAGAVGHEVTASLAGQVSLGDRTRNEACVLAGLTAGE